jgi:hypothetical protein
VIFYRLRIAIDHGLMDGLEIALKEFENREKYSPVELNYLIEAIGKLGGKPYAATLAELLDDKRVITQQKVNNETFSIEVRDVALGYLVFFTDQRLDDYHFAQSEWIFQRLRREPQRFASYNYFRFDRPDARADALAKWQAWQKRNPLPESPSRTRASK